MSLQATEEVERLKTRIEAHGKYGKHDIDEWILELAGIQEGYKIYDLGCGTGKQTFLYGEYIKDISIIGADISEELIEDAKQKALFIQNVSFEVADMNKRLHYTDYYFDLVSSCFSIYYVDNMEKVLLEIKRILKTDGKLLIVAPTEENAKEFVELHCKVNNLSLPTKATERAKRTKQEVIPLINKHFKNVKVNIFHNELCFTDVESFMSYYESTLLFKESSNDSERRKKYASQMSKAIKKIILNEGMYLLKKEVYGITGIRKKTDF